MPSGGSSMPFFAISLRRNLSGICTKMPAPSPVAGSEPLAPRWSIWAFIVRVFTMMSWERLPFEVGDETDAAGVFFVRRMPKSLGLGPAKRRCQR